MRGPEVHRCEALTARRGLQCLRQAMHIMHPEPDSELFLCQQHWEMYMESSQGYRLS